MKAGWKSISAFSSVQSFMWRGKDCVVDLQGLIAQVRKLRVRSFILRVCVIVMEGLDWWVWCKL